MASITFLGTGPGDVLPGKSQAAILLQSETTKVLLDAGEPCAGELLNLGFSLPELDAVLISHAHVDHVGGLPLLLQASWLRGRTQLLPLGLPGHLVDPLSLWLRAILLPSEVLSFPLESFAWVNGTSRTIGDLQITPHRTSHLDLAREKLGDATIEGFLFEIQTPKLRIIYTGDIGSVEDLRSHLDRPVDLLICELAHIEMADLITVLIPAKIETLCLTHLSAAADERRGDIKLLCEQHLPKTNAIYLPEDSEVIDL